MISKNLSNSACSPGNIQQKPLGKFATEDVGELGAPALVPNSRTSFHPSNIWKRSSKWGSVQGGLGKAYFGSRRC